MMSSSKIDDQQNNANIYYEKPNRSKHQVPPSYKNAELGLQQCKIINVNEIFDEHICTVEGVEGRIKYFPDYISSTDAENLYNYLIKNLQWKQREGANTYGEKYFEPRLTFWFGERYTYSSVAWESNLIWDEEVDKLRARLSKEHPIDHNKEYNSVMCNYYRDKNDSIGWHADDEIFLGRHPKIASISLGCKRVFEVCKKDEYYSRTYNNGPKNSIFKGCTILYRFNLSPGSLLVMEGSIQEKFLHRVPKENSEMSGRINLTYRYIVNEEEKQLEIERRRSRKTSYKKADNNMNTSFSNKTRKSYQDVYNVREKIIIKYDREYSARSAKTNYLDHGHGNKSNDEYNSSSRKKREYNYENNNNNQTQEKMNKRNKPTVSDEVAKSDYNIFCGRSKADENSKTKSTTKRNSWKNQNNSNNENNRKSNQFPNENKIQENDKNSVHYKVEDNTEIPVKNSIENQIQQNEEKFEHVEIVDTAEIPFESSTENKNKGNNINYKNSSEMIVEEIPREKLFEKERDNETNESKNVSEIGKENLETLFEDNDSNLESVSVD